MPLTEADWNAARDAGLSADEVSVWRLPGVPPGGEAEARAVWIPPEEQVKSTHRFPLRADLVQSLNSPEAIARHRVLAFDEVDEELIFGYVAPRAGARAPAQGVPASDLAQSADLFR
jgi:hypothetical protein